MSFLFPHQIMAIAAVVYPVSSIGFIMQHNADLPAACNSHMQTHITLNSSIVRPCLAVAEAFPFDSQDYRYTGSLNLLLVLYRTAVVSIKLVQHK